MKSQNLEALGVMEPRGACGPGAICPLPPLSVALAMADNRFVGWVHDTDLASQMKEYTKKGFTRNQMLDYLREVSPQYPWSSVDLHKV